MNQTKYILSIFLISAFRFLSSQDVDPIRIEVDPDGMIPGKQQDSLYHWILNNLHRGGGLIVTLLTISLLPLSRLFFVFFLLIFISSQFVFSQSHQLIKITEADMNDPNEIKDWVMNILHGGGGEFDTASIKFTGNLQQIGKFELGAMSIGMDTGLVISNGQVMQIQSYNNFDVSYDFNGPSDADLDSLYSQEYGLNINPFPPPVRPYTGDAAVIEFNYIPYGDEIKLRYVFGSEEYPYLRFPLPPSSDIDFTGLSPPYSLDSMFDIFAIQIDRPGRPPVNLAVLPEIAGGEDVVVNTVNVDTNYSFFVPNPGGMNSLGVQFDGFTKSVDALLIRKKVTPCITYKIKIAIEDFLIWKEDQNSKGYYSNSGVFLGGGSLIGGTKTPSWTVDYQWTSPHPVFNGKLIEGGCNDLLVTFKLEYASSGANPYYIPFKVKSSIYRDNLIISYDDTGEVLPSDSVTFNYGETEKTIRLSAVNLTTDIANVRFTYPRNPCERPHPPIEGGNFTGFIPFEMINNEPFSFTVNPKEYSAYCKETIPLTLSDVTNGGVNPVVYIWPTNPTPPVDVYNYTVNASPDWVNVEVKDLCGNDTTTKIKINNKPIKLKGIQSIFLCGPGQEATVPVQTIIPNPDDMPGYSIEHVFWKRQAPLPEITLGDQDGDKITVVYDNVVGDAVWTCWYEATDICGGKADSVFTVNQSSLVLDNTGVCNGETIELTTGTPALWYKWYRRDGSNWILIGENQTTYDDTYPSSQLQINYKLEIEDNCSEYQEAEMTVFVDRYEPDIIYIPKDELCMGEEITLEANESQASQVTYSWIYASNVVGTDRTLTVGESDYQAPGTYNYTLQTVSESQYFYCTNSTEAEFTVHANPSSAFSIDPPDNACTNTDILFDYNDDINNKTFLWNFGDGITSTKPHTSHQYGNPGTYNVNLAVGLTYPTGHVCSSDSIFIITVDPLPSPDFSADVLQGCLPVEVQFQDQTADVAPGATYEWTFGDGNTSGQQNPANQYTTPGLFTVSLTVHNTARCAATSTKPNYIQANPNPVAKFEADPWITTLDTPDIDFSDLSTSDSTITGYEWDFGDGTTSTEENPTHTYTQAGEYEVILYVETVNGCVDTTIAKVALTEEVKLFMPNAFTPNGDGINDVFEIKGTPVSNFNLYIYDRWGKEIWSTHNFETQWDGTDFNGKPVPTGTYIYTISGTDYKKRDISFKGTVTVVK